MEGSGKIHQIAYLYGGFSLTAYGTKMNKSSPTFEENLVFLQN